MYMDDTRDAAARTAERIVAAAIGKSRKMSAEFHVDPKTSLTKTADAVPIPTPEKVQTDIEKLEHLIHGCCLHRCSLTARGGCSSWVFRAVFCGSSVAVGNLRLLFTTTYKPSDRLVP